MLKKLYIIVCLIIVSTSCKSSSTYNHTALFKVYETEQIKRIINEEIIDFESIIYKNESGELLNLDSIRKIPNFADYTSDKYADSKGIIREMVVRIASEEDKESNLRIQQAYNYQPPLKQVAVDCEKKSELLNKIYALDQEMRKSENLANFDAAVDRQNLIEVISLIEKCGMPTLKEVTQKQMDAIWLVFQHADHDNRKKYFALLQKSAKNGDLTKIQIAMMQDRILMSDGKAQIYGSQIIENLQTNEWELYHLDNPESVDKRRFEVELGSLKEYLKAWNIEFDVSQKN